MTILLLSVVADARYSGVFLSGQAEAQQEL